LEAFPLKEKTAIAVAETLVSQFFTRYGVPLLLQTDQGKEFEAELFKELLERLGIKKVRISRQRPQGQGGVERVHQTILSLLKKILAAEDESQSAWEDYLPFILMRYRVSNHSSTGYSPHELFMGRQMNIPLEWLLETPPALQPMSAATYYSSLEERIEKIHKVARSNSSKALENFRARYDRVAVVRKFSVGQPVWVYFPVRKKGRMDKLWPKFIPGVISTVVSSTHYRVSLEDCKRRSRELVFHVDFLRPRQNPEMADNIKPEGLTTHRRGKGANQGFRTRIFSNRHRRGKSPVS
jgi:transposase InsO family protein